jgi:coatomer subunit beta'
VYTISHFDTPYYVLGYLVRDGRIYLCNKDVGVTSYSLSLSVIEYETLVLRGDLDAANEMLPDIPADQKNKIARFLEGQGYKELALEVASDPEHRFDLALALGRLDVALELAEAADTEHKWKTVGDTALANWDVKLATRCFEQAKDLGSLLLLYTATANAEGLKKLAEDATSGSGSTAHAPANNVKFACLWQLGDIDAAIDMLVSTNRTPEAVLFAQTYKPSRAREVVLGWRSSLDKEGRGKVGRLLGVPPAADGAEGPEGDEEMFPEWNEWLRLEKEGPAEVEEEEAEEDGGEEDGEMAAAAEVDADGDVE